MVHGHVLKKRSGCGEAHLREHGMTEQAVRIGERFQHFKMIVSLADQKLVRLSG